MGDSLAAALLEAQAEVGTIGKESRNPHHGFNYTSAEAMISYGRPLLVKHGLLLTLRGHRLEIIAEGEFWLGKVVACARLDHPASKESAEWPVELAVCEGKGRPLDKAQLGSETEIWGYTLRDLLAIDRQETGDSVSGRDDTAHSGRKRGRRSSTIPTEEEFVSLWERYVDLAKAARVTTDIGRLSKEAGCKYPAKNIEKAAGSEYVRKMMGPFLQERIATLGANEPVDDEMPEWDE